MLQAVDAALDKKAADPVVLDLRELSHIADYFVLLTGRSDTQVRAIAASIEERGRREGFRPIAVDGTQHGQWALIDYGDFIVHVFYEPVRQFYDLEKLWAKAPRQELPRRQSAVETAPTV